MASVVQAEDRGLWGNTSQSEKITYTVKWTAYKMLFLIKQLGMTPEEASEYVVNEVTEHDKTDAMYRE